MMGMGMGTHRMGMVWRWTHGMVMGWDGDKVMGMRDGDRMLPHAAL